MNEENEKIEQNDGNDPVFGGCQYRLSYEKSERRAEKKPIDPKSALIIVLVVAAFAVIGFLILLYFKGSIRKIFAAETARYETRAAAVPDVTLSEADAANVMRLSNRDL